MTKLVSPPRVNTARRTFDGLTLGDFALVVGSYQMVRRVVRLGVVAVLLSFFVAVVGDVCYDSHSSWHSWEEHRPQLWGVLHPSEPSP